MDSTQALANQLSSPGGLSKKYRMTVGGMIAVMLLFFMAGSAFIFSPATLLPLLDFAKSMATVVGTIVATYSLGQAAVDYKTTASLGSK